MLWNKGLITAAGVIVEIFIPSVVSMVIPALILQTMLKGFGLKETIKTI